MPLLTVQRQIVDRANSLILDFSQEKMSTENSESLRVTGRLRLIAICRPLLTRTIAREALFRISCMTETDLPTPSWILATIRRRLLLSIMTLTTNNNDICMIVQHTTMKQVAQQLPLSLAIALGIIPLLVSNVKVLTRLLQNHSRVHRRGQWIWVRH